MLNISDYKPTYIEREGTPCPHCGNPDWKRTNRYLFRCTNNECGRYW